MKLTTRRMNPALAAATLVFTLFAALSAFAMPFFQTVTVALNGGSCGEGAGLSDTSCLSTGVAIATGDDLVINTISGGGNGANFVYDLASSVLINSLTIGNDDNNGDDFSLNAGTSLELQSGGYITDNNIDMNGTDLFNAGITLNGPATFTLYSTDGNANFLTFGAPISGAGPLTIVNNNHVVALLLNAVNTYTGATNVSAAGVVTAAVDGIIPITSALTVASGSVVTFQASSHIASLAGAGRVFLSSGALTVGSDGTSTTFSGVFANLGGVVASLVKLGAGTLTLSGPNTYTGTTTVSAGTLLVNNSLTSSSSVTVQSGATLGGTGTVQNVTFAAGSNLSPAATLTFTGTTTPAATSTTVSPSNGTPVYGTSVTITATVSSGGLAVPEGSVTLTDTTTSAILGTALALNGAGQVSVMVSTLTAVSHTITAVYNPDPGHSTSMNTTTVNVGKGTLSVVATLESKAYGTTYNPTVFTTSGLANGDTVTGVTLTSTGSPATAPAGPYTIYASAAIGSGLGNYNITYYPNPLTVTQVPLTVTATNSTKAYGTVFSGTAFTTSTLLNTDTVTSVTLTSAVGGPATATIAGGPYAIVPSAAVGSGVGNYNITYVNGSLTVGIGALTVTASNANKAYGTLFSGTAFTTSGLASGDTVTGVTLTSAAGGPVTASIAGGPYAIVPSAAVGSGLANYNITYDNGSLTVTTATLTVTATSSTKVYGITFAPTAFTTSGLANGNTVTGVTLTSSGGAPTATVAASPYLIAPSAALGSGLANYNIIYVIGSLTVTRATLTVTATSSTKVYGTTSAPTAFTTSGLANGDTVTGVTLTSAGGAPAASMAASPYSVAPSAALGSGLGNYNITYVAGSLTVTPALLTVTVNAASMFAGSGLPPFTTLITGFVNGQTSALVSGTPGLITNATSSSPAGSYPIYATPGTLSAVNYTFQFVNGLLTVSTAPPGSITVVTGGAQTGVQGTALPAPLVVMVRDTSGNPLSGASVAFTVVSGSAALNPQTAITGPAGVAQTTVTATAPGAIVISASVAGLGAVAVFDETGIAPAALSQLSVLPPSLTFTAVQGGGNPPAASLAASVAISNRGAGALPWTATTGAAAPWLSLANTSGAGPASDAVIVNPAGLQPGSYQGTITVTSGAQTQTVTVALTLQSATPAQFTLTPAAIVVNASAQSPALISRSIGIASAGSAAFSWTAAADSAAAAWLSVSPASGTAASLVTAQVNPSSLTPGQYLGDIAFGSPGLATAIVGVVLNVSALPSLVSPVPLLEFRGPAASSFAPQSLSVTASDGSALPYTAGLSVAVGASWLTLGGATGSTPATVSALVNTSGLAPGYYVGYISVQSAGARNSLLVPVVLDLGSATAPGTLAALPGGVLLSGTAGSTGALTQTIALSSDAATFSWSATPLLLTPVSNVNWLTVSPAGGSGNGAITITASLAGLSPGSYSGQVAIGATGTSNAILIIPVTLIVTSGLSPSVTAASTLQPIQPAGDFIANAGVPVALLASFLSPAGAPVVGGTAQVSFSTGDAPVILTDSGGGTYTGYWTPLQVGAVSLLFSSPNAPTLIVTGAVAATPGNQPAFTASAAVGAAGFVSGIPLGIGSISTLFGQNLAPQTASAVSFPLPLSLGGTSVTVNGIAAPLFYASPGQINFFVPYALAGQSTATIGVSTAAGVVDVASVPIAPQSPGAFTIDAAGDAAATHLSGQVVGAAAPAIGGEVLEIFATGLGPVSNAPPMARRVPSPRWRSTRSRQV